MFTSLKRWLGLDGDADPIVRLVGGLPEPQAEMYRELLQDNGIPAAVRDTGALAAYRMPLQPTFELMVKRSDAERARLLLTREDPGDDD